ncbi:hypothetical protein COU76_03960 [Candidatus Peregrinibacteria bacterium CG10_big_fil_rev_8_21_14_0_10_49_10]|nr:MAG: hypothetical protein COU76_03960 [Candidatus Peregrinibacteria bacterium CG10_big_fil_rev_8_21_14_0_10_49_10]
MTGLQTVRPNPPQIYQKSADPRISYELIPNIRRKAYRQTVTTNSLGLRSPEPDATKDTIVMLGDSIAFGYGIADEETLAAQLAEHWTEFNVLNAGTPGYHLGMETALYEEKLAELNPVMLMLVFHYNDFDAQTGWLDALGIIRAPNWEPTEQECNPITTGLLGLLPGKCWLDGHSAFYKAVKKLVNMRAANEALTATRTQEEKPEAPHEDTTKEQLLAYLAQMDALMAILPKNMPKVFIIWPDRYLHEKSRPQLNAAVEKRGFTVVDLYNTFGNEVEVLGWDTVHPSPSAVAEAAEVISAYLGLSEK